MRHIKSAWLAGMACVLLCTNLVVAGDFDGDGDVDHEDFGIFQACLTGNGQPVAADCLYADLDGDRDVDLEDFSVFRQCMSGPNVPAAIGCIIPPLADTTLVPPARMGPILGTTTGYEVSSGCPRENLDSCEIPIFRPYDRDTDEWWDNLVEELLHSRVHVVMMLGRGCYDPVSGDSGNGNMCPRLLRHMVDAIDRSDGARDVLRLAMFDDTGAYKGARNNIEGLPSSTPFDLADPSAWNYFWDYNMRIWFDTVPPDLWYRLDGRPVVAFWGPVWMVNIQNNASQLFQYLRTNFINRYGEDPHFNVTSDWLMHDNTLTTQHVQAAEDWFDPRNNTYTYNNWNNATWGCVVPAFRDPFDVETGEEYLPGCGSVCREQLRNDGATLRSGLAMGFTEGARFTLLEGWTDVAESAGYYRSDVWRYPSQYINIVREYADPETETLRFQVEAADAFFDTTPANTGGFYRDGNLDIGRLTTDVTGWYVGWTQAGEWLQFKEVFLACGTYRFTVRLNGAPGQRVHFEIDGESLGLVEIVRDVDPGWHLLRLGICSLSAGLHDLKLVFDTGGTNVDWFFSRKISSIGLACSSINLKAINGPYVTARNGGAGNVRADSSTAGAYESFTLIDHNGGLLMSGDTVSLMTWNGHNYLMAVNGGGGLVTATATAIGNWERFTIIRIGGTGQINYGDSVALQASNGQYVVAELGGGDIVNANRDAIGPWEKFQLGTNQ
ncbi:MAG: DUF5010 domain-containing protein [Planctomycetota bacterium]|jgi:hypothetical protein